VGEVRDLNPRQNSRQAYLGTRYEFRTNGKSPKTSNHQFCKSRILCDLRLSSRNVPWTFLSVAWRDDLFRQCSAGRKTSRYQLTPHEDFIFLSECITEAGFEE
jgi:hypothetical protein